MAAIRVLWLSVPLALTVMKYPCRWETSRRLKHHIFPLLSGTKSFRMDIIGYNVNDADEVIINGVPPG